MHTRERSQETAVDKESLRENRGPSIERSEVTQKICDIGQSAVNRSEQIRRGPKDASKTSQGTEEDKKYLKQDRGFVYKRTEDAQERRKKDGGPTCMVEAYSVY